MRLSDLIDQLTEIQEDLDNDPEVRLMIQPTYPFEYSIKGVVTSEEFSEDRITKESNTVFIIEGGQLKYGNKEAFNCC